MSNKRTYPAFLTMNIILPGCTLDFSAEDEQFSHVLQKAFQNKQKIAAVYLDPEDEGFEAAAACTITVDKRYKKGSDTFYQVTGHNLMDVSEGGLFRDSSQGQPVISAPEVENPHIELTDMVWEVIEHALANFNEDRKKEIEALAEEKGWFECFNRMLLMIPQEEQNVIAPIVIDYMNAPAEQKGLIFALAISQLNSLDMFNSINKLHQLGHYKAAADAFRETIETAGVFREAYLTGLLKACNKLHNYEESVSFFNDNRKTISEGTGIDLAAGLACYYTGEEIRAGKLFARFLKNHENMFPFSKVYSQPAPSFTFKGDLKNLFQDNMRKGILPYCTFQYILPVILGIREVTCAPALRLFNERPSEPVVNYLSDLLYRQYGIYTTPLLHLRFPEEDRIGYEYYFYFHKSPSLREKLKNFHNEFIKLLEKRGPKEAIEFRITFEGPLLGYPDCCIAAEREKAAENPFLTEQYASQLAALAFSHWRNSRYPEYFTEGFHPCIINCENALAEAKRIAEALGRQDKKLERLYSREINQFNFTDILKWRDADDEDMYDEINEDICRAFTITWDNMFAVTTTLHVKAIRKFAEETIEKKLH